MGKLTREELVDTILEIESEAFCAGMRVQYGEGKEIRNVHEMVSILIKKINDLDKIEELT